MEDGKRSCGEEEEAFMIATREICNIEGNGDTLLPSCEVTHDRVRVIHACFHFVMFSYGLWPFLFLIFDIRYFRSSEGLAVCCSGWGSLHLPT